MAIRAAETSRAPAPNASETALPAHAAAALVSCGHAARRFAHVETWVFDLDNTLYPPAVRLFDQIEARMTAYVMRALRVAEAEATACATTTGAPTAPRSPG